MTASSPEETILDRLRTHAQTQPNRLAYRFLRDDNGSDSLTFRQLDRRVRGLAARFREHATRGDRALLLHPPGLEFIEAFLGCLAAGVIAVPAYPPRRNRKAERLQAIAKDSQPRLILTTHKVLPTVETCELGNANGLIHLATDDSELEIDNNRPLPKIAGDTVALLQYTSGSTGTPRGVIVTHNNLTSNERAIQTAFRHTRESVFANWLPPFHDMGLIGNILQPLFVGFPSILLAPNSFVREPVRWLRAITEYRATTAGAPNFAYDHCVRGITEEQKQDLDLRSWSIAYNGSEPVRAETLDRFAEAFGGCGFRRAAFFACYGLAEATLYVSGGPAGEEPRRLCVRQSALEAGQVEAAEPSSGRWLVSSGRPADRTKVVTVDPVTRMVVQDRSVGELWVSSPGVAAGYWGQEGGSSTAFGNYTAGCEGPFLSTGDLGFLDGGEVFVTGRSKDLIIIRGRNIYPQDVEAVVARVIPLNSQNGIAAFAVEIDGVECVAVVIEVGRQLAQRVRRIQRTPATFKAGTARGTDQEMADIDTLLARVRRAVTDEFDIPVSVVAFVKPGMFPRTSSGKVQRHVCRERLRDGTLDAVHVWKAANVGPVVNLGHKDRIAGPGSRENHASANGEVGQQLPAEEVETDPLLSRRDTWREIMPTPASPALPYGTAKYPSVRRLRQPAVLETLLMTIRSIVQASATTFDPDIASGAGDDVPLSQLGVDSVSAVGLVVAIEKIVKRPLQTDILYQYDTIARLSFYLGSLLAQSTAGSEGEFLENSCASSPLTTPPAFTIRFIHSQDEFREVCQLRYQVFVEELGRRMQTADHERRVVEDELDETGHVIAAFDLFGQVIGSARINFIRDGSVEKYLELYRFSSLSRSEAAQCSISTRLIVAPTHRNQGVSVALARQLYDFAGIQGIRRDYADCTLGNLTFFTRLGYKLASREKVWHPDHGESYVLILDLDDIDHLGRINSPLLGSERTPLVGATSNNSVPRVQSCGL